MHLMHARQDVPLQSSTIKLINLILSRASLVRTPKRINVNPSPSLSPSSPPSDEVAVKVAAVEVICVSRTQMR